MQKNAFIARIWKKYNVQLIFDKELSISSLDEVVWCG